MREEVALLSSQEGKARDAVSENLRLKREMGDIQAPAAALKALH